MNHYRITKYNPENRDAYGAYLVSEWSSISDIGKAFNQHVFTEEQYINTENAYLETLRKILSLSDTDALFVDALEKREFVYGTCLGEVSFNKLKIGDQLEIETILGVAQLALRESLWCKLRKPWRCYIHFGYDFYMYVGCRLSKDVIEQIAKSYGLYAENFRSPYL